MDIRDRLNELRMWHESLHGNLWTGLVGMNIKCYGLKDYF